IDHALEKLLGLPTGSYALDWAAAASTYHPDDRHLVRSALVRAITGRTDVCQVEARRIRADGTFLWVSNFGRVTERDAAGRATRMVGTTTDIDQRKEIELNLRDREQRLRLALEAGNLGVWEYDLATDRMHFD